MPSKSQAENLAELTETATEIFLISILDNDNNSNNMEVEDLREMGDLGGIEDLEENQEGLGFRKERDDMLEIIALNAIEFVNSFSGTGSYGPYNGIARSKDYFATLLQQPDQRFRYVFRVVHSILYQNSNLMLLAL
jgi:hypothetical protein